MYQVGYLVVPKQGLKHLENDKHHAAKLIEIK
jgi:hypothetical protein